MGTVLQLDLVVQVEKFINNNNTIIPIPCMDNTTYSYFKLHIVIIMEISKLLNNIKKKVEQNMQHKYSKSENDNDNTSKSIKSNLNSTPTTNTKVINEIDICC
eukprot:153873_1